MEAQGSNNFNENTFTVRLLMHDRLLKILPSIELETAEPTGRGWKVSIGWTIFTIEFDNAYVPF